MIHVVIDFIGILGIIMLGYGLWLVAPVYMFCILGVMLTVFSLCAESGTITIRKRKKN